MNAKTLFSASLLIAAGMLVGRLLGFLREILIAAQYATGAEANVAIGLLIIPDYITGMLIGSALGAVLVPAFAARDDAGRRALFWHAFILTGGVFFLLSLLVYAQAPAIAALLYGAENHVAANALLWALLSMPLAGMSGVITAWLQHHGRFMVPAFANAIFNVVVVLTLWLNPQDVKLLGLGIFAAALVRLCFHSSAFMRSGGALPVMKAAWQMPRSMLVHYASAAGNTFLSLLPQYMPYAVITATMGSLALFNYAFKLVLLPAMLLATIVQLVLLPWFVRLRAQQKDSAACAVALRIALVVCIAMALVLSMASQHVVALCFGYGEMTAQDITRVAQLFAIGIWGLPGVVASYIWQQFFYARTQPNLPLRVSTIVAIICVPLLWWLQRQHAELGTIAGYAALQVLPMLLFMRIAAKQGALAPAQLLDGMLPILLVMAILFAASWLLYSHLVLSPLVGVLFAGTVGVIMLTAALYCDKPSRKIAIEWIKNRRNL